MSARSAALRAAVVKFLSDRVAEAFKDAKADVLDQLDPGDRKGAVLGEGIDVGTVSVTRGRKTIGVVDESAFTKWVRENAPHNIEERVRPAYVKSIADSATVVGGQVVTTDGEIVPGLAQREGDPYASVRLSDEQTINLAAALEAGDIDVRAILAPERKEIEQ